MKKLYFDQILTFKCLMGIHMGIHVYSNISFYPDVVYVTVQIITNHVQALGIHKKPYKTIVKYMK